MPAMYGQGHRFARRDIVAVADDDWQDFADQADRTIRQRLRHRGRTGRHVGFDGMRQRVHASRRRHVLRHGSIRQASMIARSGISDS